MKKVIIKDTKLSIKTRSYILPHSSNCVSQRDVFFFLLPGSKKTTALRAAYSLSSIWISWKGCTSSSSTLLAILQISGSGLFLWITQPLPADTKRVVQWGMCQDGRGAALVSKSRRNSSSGWGYAQFYWAFLRVQLRLQKQVEHNNEVLCTHVCLGVGTCHILLQYVQARPCHE